MPENDNGSEAGKNQNWLIGERILKGLRRTLKCSVNGAGHAEFATSLLDVINGGAERSAGSEIWRKSNSPEDALVVDGERGIRGLVVGEGAERNELAGFGGHIN